MNSLRKKSLERLFDKSPRIFQNDKKYSELFASNVFTINVLEQYVSKDTFNKLLQSVNKGSKINRSYADQIAASIKAWALSKGATHYTHWFQPLTGGTAEKHDAFFDLQTSGKSMESFDGSQLAQQEPDASSFPSGGIRNTFEARGYTAWDPTSPAFIFGKTLCIPTIFVSYTGEVLDYKTPLLKSIQSLDNAATEICKLFDKNVVKVNATLGWEQEYFLIDRAIAASRSDLIITGRTLFGHQPSKGQQLDDHYFGSIPPRVINYMQELEFEAMQLGIPLKTRHNEVAPGQFELAPIFEEANLSVDHNSLLMDLMNKIATKHDFIVLFHEKPFEGINGSGKHNNWSLSTNKGVNLLSPGKTPMSNLQFLTFFINTIAAVQSHEGLMRASIASSSNDNRLGSNEAPPSIISVFIGKQLSSVLDDLENVSKGKLSPEEKTDLKLNVIGKIPEILLDNTDRNRTSPFAFTGNKFEFRAVGSKSNCAKSITVLNAAVAQQLQKFGKEVEALIEKKDMKKDDAIFNALRDNLKGIKNILFEGDGYSELWKKEAVKRGLSYIQNTPEALKAYVSKKSIALFEQMNVLSEREVKARYMVDLKEYTMRIQIESRTLGDIARNHIIPTGIKYQNVLIQNVKGLKEIYGEDYYKFADVQIKIIERISGHIEEINKGIVKMIETRKKINEIEDEFYKASSYCKKVLPFLTDIRYHCDKLELVVDDDLWPLAKYRELLFCR
ncbi:MAG: glutamine synthetase type III [Flavobacteriaceae bacterium]|nr:glutamine synthetase type III [Flavobacteriaceae bacterium]|tara:strand:- start:1533 stop:3719 length:2187 start_codon:yes stop_codon:yes gene_type:complete